MLGTRVPLQRVVRAPVAASAQEVRTRPKGPAGGAVYYLLVNRQPIRRFEASDESMVELISIHIPKTAGVSFQGVLRQVYGDGLVCDYGGAVRGLDRARVVHGHFAARRYRSRWPEASVVTWMRDPVDRVISYYYYWLDAAPHGNPNHDRFLAERPSLVEFARAPEVQSEVAHYLDAIEPRDFRFVGFVDRFDADVRRLARLLEWPPIEVPRRNVTARPAISPDTRRLVAEACRAERKLYERMRAAWSA